MQMPRFTGKAGLLAVLFAAGCQSLDVTNPNLPDARRALADPAALEGIAAGTLATWYNTWEDMESAGALSAMARTYSASWNNFNLNFYSSVDGDGTRNSRAWQNDLASAGRTNVENGWFGYYSAISSATDVLKAIRQNNIVIGNASNTRRAETIAQLTLGASHMALALLYDKGYVITESSDLTSLAYADRRVMRDSAVAFLQRAATLAAANAFTTPADWTGGRVYSNTEIARIANTLSAMALAYWPRTSAENASVDWARVATFASNGVTFDFDFIADGCSVFCPEILLWFNSMDTGVVHTRVANLLDPATQQTPYPSGGNPRPNSPDRRLGNGSFGTAAMVDAFGNIPRDAGGGSDFAYGGYELFNPARGMYHQSNVAHIRYDASGVQSPQSIYGGFGRAPAFTRASNDLLWAEAELRRTGGSLTNAASLINGTRVTRGGLPAAAAADGQAVLLQRLEYEQEVELLGLGPSPFYQRRRAASGLLTGTPREMPVPARELGVTGAAFYTWGGTGAANSPTPP